MSYLEAVDPEGGDDWKGRKATRLTASPRDIKMLRPICQTCEDEVGGVKYLQPGWFKTCPHDPYVSYSEVPRTVPIYEDLEDGSKRLLRTDVITETRPRPNWVGISQTTGVNAGKGPARAQALGYIYPQQLRSPLYPNGLKRRCQFRDCFEDQNLKKYNSGWFCREIEAKLVRINDLETVQKGDFGMTRKEKLIAEQFMDSVQVAL